jgi:hypothetical protein
MGSFLDAGVRSRIAALNEPARKFAIVHSWGVLHHTGGMRAAIQNAASLVDDDGHLVLAIYNRHWSSRAWLLVKWVYGSSPRWFRPFLTGFFYPIIAGAKFCVTGKNPFRKNRGGWIFYYRRGSTGLAVIRTSTRDPAGNRVDRATPWIFLRQVRGGRGSHGIQ